MTEIVNFSIESKTKNIVFIFSNICKTTILEDEKSCSDLFIFQYNWSKINPLPVQAGRVQRSDIAWQRCWEAYDRKEGVKKESF